MGVTVKKVSHDNFLGMTAGTVCASVVIIIIIIIRFVKRQNVKRLPWR